MNFEEFMREKFLKSGEKYLIDIHTDYSDKFDALQIFSERILEELGKSNKEVKQLLGKIKGNEWKTNEEIKELSEKYIKDIKLLRTDIVAYYFFIRALMDVFCRIIIINYRKKGKPLSHSMNRLLEKIKNKKNPIEDAFFNDLPKQLEWFPKFKDERDNLLHELHTIIIMGDNLGTHFQVGTQKGTFSSAEMILIDEFVKDTNKKIEELKEFLMKNLISISP